MSKPAQVLIVLDVDVETPLPIDDVWARVSAPFERREVLTLSAHGAPDVQRFREGIRPDQWEALERAVERLADRTLAVAGEAAHREQQCELYVCGQAPLALFALLGRLLGARLQPLTLLNRRGDGTWDVILLDASVIQRGAFFDVVSGLDGGERNGRVAIFVSTQGQPAPTQLLEDFFHAQKEDRAGLIEIRASRPIYLDAGNALAAQRQVGEVLSQVSSAYPRASGIALFLAVPAPLAYLVGRAVPKYLGEVWLTNHEHTEGRQAYTRVLPRPSLISEPPPSGHVGPIDHLEIRDLRLLGRLTVDPKPRTDGDGQWIILLGDNGVGKTTILRAIALALVEPELATILLSKLPAPLRRRGAPTGVCHVHTRGGDFHTDILEKGDLEIAQARRSSSARRPLIFGYGCRRGSALGGPAQNVSFSPPTLELATLFDESASLIHAETWLKERALEAEQNKGKPKEALFRAVLAALTGLLPDAKSIEVRDNRVWVDLRDAGWVPLAALSDGYITTAGWVIDLVARWIDRATRHGEALKPDFTTSMEGFVLVDEIDLHLHPRWQCEVIANLRHTFPKMSFVVTTHNPLTLLGAEDGEIFVLDRVLADGGAEGPVTIEQVDLPKGARADQVLTGRWFGLPYAYDKGTVGLLEQHQAMLLGGTPADDPARVVLEEELRKRLGTFADTALDRMALSVAAELMSEQKPISPEDRSRLRERLKERLRAKLAERSGSSE